MFLCLPISLRYFSTEYFVSYWLFDYTVLYLFSTVSNVSLRVLAMRQSTTQRAM